MFVDLEKKKDIENSIIRYRMSTVHFIIVLADIYRGGGGGHLPLN